MQAWIKFTSLSDKGGSMTTVPGTGKTPSPSPEEAFGILGDDTRIRILQTLGTADGPLAFSELFDRIEYDDSSNFGYHLEKLVGHFVEKTDDGYALAQPGRRVVEAVLSGAVTDDPVLDRTAIDRPCPFCRTDVEVAYRQEHVSLHCPDCFGLQDRPDVAGSDGVEFGNLGHLLLPPAGVRNRAPADVLRAAEIWTATEMQSVFLGVCRRCSGAVKYDVEVCDGHELTAGICDACGQRFGAHFSATCTNCIFQMEAPMVTYLGPHPQMKRFLMDHDIEPFSSEAFVFHTGAVEETRLIREPFEATYTFSLATEQLSMTVNDVPSVTDVTRRETG
ncbi:MAG: helix-turn-helix domain-containing protein [Haloarculaceae archaeon]